MNESQLSNDRELNTDELMRKNPRYRPNDPRRKNPFYSGLLSVMPGLGQVYVGYYRRGFTNALTVGSIWSILLWAGEDAPFFALGIIFLIFFELYNIIDAARRATMYNLTLDGIEQITLPDELSDDGLTSVRGSFLGGGALLLFGVIALSNTLFGFSLEWLDSWWPVAPIALGGYLVYKAYVDNQAGLPNGVIASVD